MDPDLSLTLIASWKQDQNKKGKKLKPILNNYLPNKTESEKEKTIAEINEAVSAKIDCLQCANCCKTTVTTFTMEDINKASKFLKISKQSFIKKYLIDDLDEFTTITTPCPFLLADNKCGIYEVRPHSCRSFPHTGRKNFINLYKVHENNYEICPITYNMVKNIEYAIK